MQRQQRQQRRQQRHHHHSSGPFEPKRKPVKPSNAHLSSESLSVSRPLSVCQAASVDMGLGGPTVSAGTVMSR